MSLSKLPPIYQVTIDPWLQIYRELEDEGVNIDYHRGHYITNPNNALL